MSNIKFIDRYEPLESILTIYKRWGQSSTLIKHIFTYISNNLRVKKEDRRYLFNCMFNQQQQREKKVKNFIASVASDLSLEDQQNLIEQLVIQTKQQINKLQDGDLRIELSNNLNNRLYRHLNIIKAFRQNSNDFIDLFELWHNYSLTC
jgi:hypothetical protein